MNIIYNSPCKKYTIQCHMCIREPYIFQSKAHTFDLFIIAILENWINHRPKLPDYSAEFSFVATPILPNCILPISLQLLNLFLKSYGLNCHWFFIVILTEFARFCGPFHPVVKQLSNISILDLPPLVVLEPKSFWSFYHCYFGGLQIWKLNKSSPKSYLIILRNFLLLPPQFFPTAFSR